MEITPELVNLNLEQINYLIDLVSCDITSEKRHYEESSEMAIEHNIDIGESDHIYFSFYRLKAGLERGEFDD